MDVLAVADIHLNLRKNFDWERDRFLTLFQWLAEQPEETILILGDTFDVANPNLDEIETFYKGIDKLHNKRVLLIDGNHEGIGKGLSVFDKLPQVGFTYIKRGIYKFAGHRVYFVSWSNLDAIGEWVKGGIGSLPNALMTHVRCAIPPHIKQEINLKDASDTFDLVVAGDIHITGHKPFDNFYYTGQPYSNKYKTKGLQSVLRLKFEKNKETEVEYVYTQFANKILKTVDIDDIPKVSNKDLYKFKVEGTMKDLEQLKNTSNITFEKVLVEAKVEDKPKLQGKVNIKSDLITLLKDNDVDVESLSWGAEYLDTVLNEG